MLSVTLAALVAGAAAPWAGADEDRPPPSSAPLTGTPLPSATPVDPDELGFEEIVFVKRKPYSSDHYYTDINNGTSPDRFLPDNGIYIYNLRTRSERAVVTAADLPGGKGFIGKISLSFDAKKVLFDFRQDPGSGFRIWEVNIDGTGLRQVSFPPTDEAEKAAAVAPGLAHRRHPPLLSAGRQDHLLLDPLRAHRSVRRVGPPRGPGPAPDGRRRHPRRTAHAEPGQRILPGGSRRRPGDVSPLGVHRQGRPGRQDRLVDESRRDQAPGTLRPGRRRHDHLHVPATPSRQQSSLRVRGHVPLSARRLPGGDPAGRLRHGRPRARSGSGRSRITSKGTTGIRSSTSRPHVFIQRRTEPGWHFRTKEGKYVHDRRRPEGAPVHASLSRQRPASSWSRTRSIPPIITRRLPTPTPCT